MSLQSLVMAGASTSLPEATGVTLYQRLEFRQAAPLRTGTRNLYDYSLLSQVGKGG